MLLWSNWTVCSSCWVGEFVRLRMGRFSCQPNNLRREMDWESLFGKKYIAKKIIIRSTFHISVLYASIVIIPKLLTIWLTVNEMCHTTSSSQNRTVDHKRQRKLLFVSSIMVLKYLWVLSWSTRKGFSLELRSGLKSCHHFDSGLSAPQCKGMSMDSQSTRDLSVTSLCFGDFWDKEEIAFLAPWGCLCMHAPACCNTSCTNWRCMNNFLGKKSILNKGSNLIFFLFAQKQLNFIAHFCLTLWAIAFLCCSEQLLFVAHHCSPTKSKKWQKAVISCCSLTPISKMTIGWIHCNFNLQNNPSQNSILWSQAKNSQEQLSSLPKTMFQQDKRDFEWDWNGPMHQSCVGHSPTPTMPQTK